MKALFAVFLIQAFPLLFSTLPLESDSLTRKINPEEMANEFEGDIVLLNNLDPLSRSGRNGLTDSTKRWPRNTYGQVKVPYTIQGSYCNKSHEFLLIY